MRIDLRTIIPHISSKTYATALVGTELLYVKKKYIEYLVSKGEITYVYAYEKQ